MSDFAVVFIIANVAAICVFGATIHRFLELVNDVQGYFWDWLGARIGWK